MVKQKNYTDGRRMIVDPRTQEVKAVVYPDGTQEFYKNKKLIQRNFPKGKGNNAVEWYDENGGITMTKDWKGKIKDLKAKN